jgi:hypothetical protein
MNQVAIWERRADVASGASAWTTPAVPPARDITPTMAPSSMENRMMLTWSASARASRMWVSTTLRKAVPGLPTMSMAPTKTPSTSDATTCRSVRARPIATSGGSRLQAVPTTWSGAGKIHHRRRIAAAAAASRRTPELIGRE